MLKIKSRLSHTISLEKIKSSLQQFLARQDIGFTKLPQNLKALEDSKKIAKILENFDHVVVIGIGGSSMGPRALAEISNSSRISFLDNVDSLETEKIIRAQKDLRRTAWLAISKSGTTIEVLWTLELVDQVYQSSGISLWPQTFFITEETSNPLHQLAQKHQRPCLYIPLDVGGRFSVLSPVGLLIAEYLGLDSQKLLVGAAKALDSTEQVVECVGQYLASFERQEDITLFWLYNSNMRWFGCWLQQLWAESLGKKTKIDGTPAPRFSTPMISIGTCDQHSIMQQVVDGPKNKFVNIFRFNDVETSRYQIQATNYSETKLLEGLNFGDLIKAEAIATEKAFRQSGVSTVLFEMSQLDTENLGFLFMFYQLIVATIGEHEGINAFDQPGVALTKKLTLDYLKGLQPTAQ